MVMTVEEEWADVALHKAGDRKASARLLKANEGLIQVLAKRFARGGKVDLDDCLQQARIGLLEGFDAFRAEESRGGRPNSYAMIHAHRRVRQYCEKNDFVVRLPVYAERSERLDNNQHIPRDAVSLDSKLRPSDGAAIDRDGSAATYADVVAADDDTDERRAVVSALADARDGLRAIRDEREREILVREFGLDGAEPESCAEIARRWGVSRQRVQQIRSRAFVRFRAALAGEPDPVEVVGRKKKRARERKKRAAAEAKEKERIRQRRIHNFADAIGQLVGIPGHRVVRAVEREVHDPAPGRRAASSST